MKHRISNIFLFLAISVHLWGQDDPIEKLMTRRYLSCEDVTYNVSYLIPEFYEKGDRDTIQAILDFWRNRCYVPEALVRCRIVLAIDEGTFTEDLYDSHILNLLNQHHYGGYYRDYHSADVISGLNKFTGDLSLGLLTLRKDLSPVEKFFLRWYSGEPGITLAALEAEELNGTKIQDLYFQAKKQQEQMTFLHWDYMAGVWIPQNNANVLGVHPFIGFRGGFKRRKITVDVSLGFKFVKTPETYQVYKDGTLWNTDNFFGGYMGLDAAYRLFLTGKNAFYLIGGVAWDGFDALDKKKDGSDDKMTKSINSLNLNIGLGYKFHFGEKSYLGIDCKYNFVNYKNSGGTDLDGNVFTIHLIFGGFGIWNNYY
jgi:hypothetical protein